MLLSTIRRFSKQFGLVGGTAIALHLGHRRSIDFDLFSHSLFNTLILKSRIARREKIEKILVQRTGEFTFIARSVKITFFHYPYPIEFKKLFDDTVRIPNLLTLAAMKAYALGRRAKWKDYVDLYYIAKKYGDISPIVWKAKKIFGNEFNEKIFRVQLAYFKDIDYTENIVYMKGFEVSDAVIKKELIRFSVV